MFTNSDVNLHTFQGWLCLFITLKCNMMVISVSCSVIIWSQLPPTQTLDSKVALTATPSMSTALHILVPVLSMISGYAIHKCLNYLQLLTLTKKKILSPKKCHSLLYIFVFFKFLRQFSFYFIIFVPKKVLNTKILSWKIGD